MTALSSKTSAPSITIALLLCSISSANPGPCDCNGALVCACWYLRKGVYLYWSLFLSGFILTRTWSQGTLLPSVDNHTVFTLFLCLRRLFIRSPTVFHRECFSFLSLAWVKKETICCHLEKVENCHCHCVGSGAIRQLSLVLLKYLMLFSVFVKVNLFLNLCGSACVSRSSAASISTNSNGLSSLLYGKHSKYTAGFLMP